MSTVTGIQVGINGQWGKAQDVEVALNGVPMVTGDWTSDVRGIEIVNGLGRATYEDINAGQQGSHSYYLGAGRVTGPTFGDYSYWISTITAAAVEAWVVVATTDFVEVAFRFEHGAITLVKRVGMKRGLAGMFVGWRSYPAPSSGERETGLGALVSRSFASTGVVVEHPAAGANVDFVMSGQTSGPWWFAGIPTHAPGVVTFMALAAPYYSLSYQFDVGQEGYPTINQLTQDGEYFQVFWGALRSSATDAPSLSPLVATQVARAFPTLHESPGGLAAITDGTTLAAAMGYASSPEWMVKGAHDTGATDLVGTDNLINAGTPQHAQYSGSFNEVAVEFDENTLDALVAASAAVLDPSTGSFAALWVGELVSMAEFASYNIMSKREATGSLYGWDMKTNTIVGGNYQFRLDYVTTANSFPYTIQHSTYKLGPQIFLYVFNRTLKTSTLYSLETSLTRTWFTNGDGANAGLFAVGAGQTNAANTRLGLAAHWSGATAEGLNGSHLANLKTALGIA